jgi:ABC-type transporter Mla subunit MlaD
MNTSIHNSSSFTDDLKARRAHLADLLALLDVKNRTATEIEKLSTDAIKNMIGALDSQLKKRG